VAAAGLRGDLARAAGHQAAAAAAFQTAWRRARDLRMPLALAQPEISGVRWLARQRVTTLGARPYLQVCDRELASADAPAGPQTAPAWFATGRSNRQAAAGLPFWESRKHRARTFFHPAERAERIAEQITTFGVARTAAARMFRCTGRQVWPG
jgi:hypothetical protein